MKAFVPRVSVIIPTYNRRLLVQEAIDSVLAQTYNDYEIIVVDDGSTDGTGEVLNTRYGSTLRYNWQENRGESVARNWGIKAARGEFVALLDSDDLWMPEKLAKQVPMLLTNNKIGMVFCQAAIIDTHGILLDLPPVGYDLKLDDLTLEKLYLTNNVAAGGSTAVIRRSILEEVGGFDENIRLGEDWDLWLRLRMNWNFEFIHEPLAYVRRHVNTQCHLPRPENVERKLRDSLSLLKRAFAAWPGSSREASNLRNRSFAYRFAHAAFANYAWSRWDKARQYLAQAITLDPQTWQDREGLMWMLRNYGLAIAEVEGTFEIDRMRTYLDGTLTHWPASVVLPTRVRRQVMGALCAEIAYRSYLIGDFGDARRYMWQALRFDSVLLRDRGLLRRFCRALIG